MRLPLLSSKVARHRHRGAGHCGQNSRSALNGPTSDFFAPALGCAAHLEQDKGR